MRLLTPARARAGRRALPAGIAVLAALSAAAPAGAAAVAPPGRAYELVSSADTGGLDITNRVGGQAVMAGSGAGGGMALMATLGTSPGGQSADVGTAPLIAQRTAAGWVDEPVAPPLTPGVPRPLGLPNGSVSIAPTDLSSVLVATNQPMIAGVDTTVQNVFRRSFGDGGGAVSIVAAPASQLIIATPLAIGVSADGRSVLFESSDQITPDALPTSNMNLYVARDGHVALANVLPDGTASAGVGYDQASLPFQHVLSDDGRTFVFRPISNTQLYVSRDGVVSQVSRAQGGTAGSATFWAATPDGSKVLFTDTAPLTPDSSPTGGDAYIYDVADGHLTVLAPSTVTGVNPPAMRFIAASDDGATVYFGAVARLTADTPVGITRPIYRWHGGALTYVGAVTDLDATQLSGSVSPDGRFLVYPSPRANTAQPTGTTTQLYRYDADAGTTTCVSCPPDGSTATTSIGAFGIGIGIYQPFPWVQPNRLSADGRHVAFTTAAALSPRDVNGQDDVYDWTPDGLSLVSSGTDPIGSQLGDLSRDGTDILFTTRDRLLAADDDDDADLYDARLGGGFPDAVDPKGAGACAGDACQGAPSTAPPAPIAGTIAFSGPGATAADASVPREPAAVKAARGAIRGGRFTVTVKVPGAGRISASGPHVRTVRRTATKAGTYKLAMTLTASAKRSLARHRKLKVSVKVGFVPSTEKASTATLSLTVKA